MRLRPALWLLICALILGNGALWYVAVARETGKLHVSVLDVGQGDAILIEGPTGTQVLIDGGRDRSVLRRLGTLMPLFDRSIDLVIATHPDADHIGGLPGVFSRYRVSYYMDGAAAGDTAQAAALDKTVEDEDGMEVIETERGTRIDLGGGAYLDVLYPDREAPSIENNTGSVVARLVYGETSFMFTGDAPSAVEDWLVRLDGEALKSDMLKAGHHGSKTSTGEAWLTAVAPDYVAISAGKDNSYGHPSPEVVARAVATGARIVSTMEEGTLTFLSDGAAVTYK
ncbi:MAG: MBL fold metallo-hydrolase [Candidatus Pacebacteria bacterium]|nr:MBL fold metallo-hydrolase [Candidatus Paceibacterota bacterium]MBP9840150.1 MBL fold metallo-hydrolase [Candidatus Paceibacterota bacterium]